MNASEYFNSILAHLHKQFARAEPVHMVLEGKPEHERYLITMRQNLSLKLSRRELCNAFRLPHKQDEDSPFSRHEAPAQYTYNIGIPAALRDSVVERARSNLKQPVITFEQALNAHIRALSPRTLNDYTVLATPVYEAAPKRLFDPPDTVPQTADINGMPYAGIYTVTVTPKSSLRAPTVTNAQAVADILRLPVPPVAVLGYAAHQDVMFGIDANTLHFAVDQIFATKELPKPTFPAKNPAGGHNVGGGGRGA